MGQYWQLFNASSLWVSCNCGKPGEFFCSEGLPIHIRHFTIPAWSEQSKAMLCAKYPQVTHRSASPESKLLCLPDELLSMIFKYMTGLADAVCLCMADDRMFAIGFPRVIELQASAYANWAGDHVLCMGDNTDDNDLPESIQGTVDDYLEEWWEEYLLSEDYGRSLDAYLNVKDLVQKVETGFYTEEHVRSNRSLGSWPPKGFKSTKDWYLYKEMIQPKYELLHPWVLCNLSKGKYVRADVVAALTGEKLSESEPFISGGIDLGHALLSQICWLSVGSIAMSYDDNLHCGPWAGDQFEVTSMDKLDLKTTWEDVSDDIAKILVKIWESEYGADWKEEVRQRWAW
ncbi:hypothetical protein BDY19DRAFT_910510 [Irpex rosettiformis]|uniref:Uncharacterized protein n=1 Tax=Irpex rosettiformis TaxID=378272 RepID=A0ACB8TNI1_9APHY|nr:hypothetical protein BDY19DRAFT_910510 [Irpex rosettiformis]